MLTNMLVKNWNPVLQETLPVEWPSWTSWNIWELCLIEVKKLTKNGKKLGN